MAYPAVGRSARRWRAESKIDEGGEVKPSIEKKRNTLAHCITAPLLGQRARSWSWTGMLHRVLPGAASVPPVCWGPTSWCLADHGPSSACPASRSAAFGARLVGGLQRVSPFPRFGRWRTLTPRSSRRCRWCAHKPSWPVAFLGVVRQSERRSACAGVHHAPSSRQRAGTAPQWP